MKLNNLFPVIWSILRRNQTEQVQEVKQDKLSKIMDKFLNSPHGTILILKINKKRQVLSWKLKYE